MTETTTTGGGLRPVLEDLAASRGYTLAGLAEETRRRGHDYTPAEIATGGRGGFGSAIDDVLRLDDGERARVVRAVVGRLSGDAGSVPPPDEPPLPAAPGLGRYNPETPVEERKGVPVCVVSHPDAGRPCGEPATMEVWALSFCERHGEEAEFAAMAELWEDARRGAKAMLEGARERWRRNSALLYLLRQAADDAQRHEEAHAADHEDTMERAYGDADSARTHRDTLAYDPDAGEIGDPVMWWSETRRAICRAMREAHEGGLPLAADLEPLREQATAQEVLALRAATREMPA